MKRAASILALVAASACTSMSVTTPAAADEPSPPAAPRRIALRYDLALDLGVTGGLTTALVVWGIVKTDVVGTTTCVICDGHDAGDVNALDDFFRSLRRRDTSAASALSDVMGYAVGPTTALALGVAAAAQDDRLDEAPLNALLTVEATLTASVLQQGLTAIVRRERPAVHARPYEQRAAGLSSGSLESFPGGHTLLVMAATASAGTIASLRGYRLAPLIWIAGSVLGLTVSYLRIAADRHYFTDNLTGAALGLGIGAGVPLLFHGRRRPDGSEPSHAWYRPTTLTTSPVPEGRVVNVVWTF